MMGSVQEKAQRDQAKDINMTLEVAVKGLSPGSPERKAAFEKALEDIAVTVPKIEYLQPIWDFTAEKAQELLVKDRAAILRPVQVADADFYVSVKAQYSMMYRALIHMGKVDNRDLLLADLLKPESFFCIVENAKDGTPVGYIGVKDTRADIWEIAIELDGRFAHHGFGSRGIQLFLNEIHRITGKSEYQALVETDNFPSQKCFEKLGARLIGLCNGPILKLDEEKRQFEEKNLNLIDDNMKELAARMGVAPRKLLSHVLDYRLKCPL